MESKKNKFVRLLKNNTDFLLCPVCREKLTVTADHVLKCINGHSFDISRKGTVNLTGGSNDKIYDNVLFRSRRTVIRDHYYDRLTKTLSSIAADHRKPSQNGIDVLDAGCGEGSFLDKICSDLSAKKIGGLRAGIDLSRSGINMATDHRSDIIWLIDDLANLHMADGTFDVVLDILSPANHGEFKRVLRKDGIVIKVIPGKNYLTELREIIALDEESNSYDNSDTIKHTEKWMVMIERRKLEYTVTPSEVDLDAFLKMTPMTHGKIMETPTKKIHGLTIDLEVIIGKPN